MTEKIRQYKTAIFCLGASCYLFTGQPADAAAATGNKNKLQKSSPELDKMFETLKSKCASKSILDRIAEKKSQTLYSSAIDEKTFLVGTDACPGLDIPAGNSYTDTGTTIGANNTVTSVQAGCSNYTAVAGPDVIYRFALPPVASRIPTCSITVTPTGGTGYDTAIYTLRNVGANSCPAGIGNATTNCINGADVGLGNAAETITDAEMDAMPAGTYYLFIDSFYSGGSAGAPNRHNGPYTLQFTCTSLGVTSANASVSGRIVSANGSGLGKISITATGSNGQTRYAVTNSFGQYKFEDLTVGDTYVFQVSSRKYQFSNPTQVVSLSESVSDLNFETIE